MPKPHADLAATYAPLQPEHLADPYAFFARARQAPLFFSPAIDAWVVSRYEDAVTILRDHKRFASATVGARAQHSAEVKEILNQSPISAASPINLDPPEHTRVRGAITKALSARRTASLEPRVRRISEDLIKRFGERGQADFVERFARPFPVQVLGSLLDLPEADFEQLQEWADDFGSLVTGNLDPEAQISAARGHVAMQQYVFDLAERRQRQPGNDLASELIRSVDSGEVPLTSAEVAAIIFSLIAAGFETTLRLLTSCLLHLLTERHHWQAVVDDQSCIPAVVEEALRFDGPVLGLLRRAREDVELAGTTIPTGSLVQVLVASASRDEQVFPDPDAFAPHRERTPAHLGFGMGVHFCIGAPLARIELLVALEELSQRLPSLRLVAGQKMTFAPNLILRGPEHLLVAWDEQVASAGAR
jgi:cytochrome P450